MNKKENTYIDLFAGCGGLSLGLHNAGWKGIFAVEKSDDAFSTLRHNLIQRNSHFDWPDWLPQSSLEIDQLISVYKKKLKSLRGNIDLVVGGPPCQGFSMAGRRNESDQRNNLIKSYIEFIRLVQPKIIFFENVKGFTIEFIKNKDKGIAYSEYVDNELHKSGYYISKKLIDFGDYGVPQKRVRFVLIGVREDIARGNPEIVNEFFEMMLLKKDSFLAKFNINVDTSLKDAISDLLKSHGTIDSPDSKNFKAGIYGSAKSNFQILMRKNVESSVVDSHRFANHREEIIEKFEFILKNSPKNKNIDTFTREKYAIKKHRVVALDKDRKSPTITSLPDDYIHYEEPRILTVREYARVQTFPDWYEFKGKYTTGGERRIKEVPRYTQIGNAIPPLFAEQVGSVLKEILT